MRAGRGEREEEEGREVPFRRARDPLIDTIMATVYFSPMGPWCATYSGKMCVEGGKISLFEGGEISFATHVGPQQGIDMHVVVAGAN